MRKVSSLQLKNENEALAAEVISLLSEAGLIASAAESCTGGLISKYLTDIPGASSVFYGGVVSYVNSVKEKLLGVKPVTLEVFTDVSAQTALEMASGALSALGTDVSVAVTGIAGPSGGTPEKPVGLVYIASARRDGVSEVTEKLFLSENAGYSLNRSEIREKTVFEALSLLKKLIVRQ